MNWDWITENMAVGTPPESFDDGQQLKFAGITHVLNVNDQPDFPAYIEPLIYCWNPTADWNPLEPLGQEPKPVEWFKKSLDFWEPNMVLPMMRNYKLYCHCSAGVNRSATTAWMFLRALQLKGFDCDFILENRLRATFGIVFDHPWRKNAEDALRTLGYIS
jgi:hypothetical protein